jgi:hypothetical protein
LPGNFAKDEPPSGLFCLEIKAASEVRLSGPTASAALYGGASKRSRYAATGPNVDNYGGANSVDAGRLYPATAALAAATSVLNQPDMATSRDCVIRSILRDEFFCRLQIAIMLGPTTAKRPFMIVNLLDHGLPLVALKEQRRDLIVSLLGLNGPISKDKIAEIAAIQTAISAIEAVISDLDDGVYSVTSLELLSVSPGLSN